MEKDEKIREWCVEVVRHVFPGVGEVATIEEVLEAARKIEKYIKRG